ncbi:MAG TPA: prepilin-type N-terminal cleavage/methylation domain-containing protein, partial [Candidatus Methylomirabilis sp.]|nr:prepilin-type N-terminal cleavage/methylation domain-containing protein [Candidatus Methylomirabilis sp.]
SKKGFTLIELLVVIAIIGVLSTLSIVALNSARTKARDAVRLANIKQIQTALELWYNDVSRYPTSAEVTFNSPLTSNGITYMALLPTAPTPTDGTCSAAENTYNYIGYAGGTTYGLSYCLGGASGSIGAGFHTAYPGSLSQ